MHKLHILCLCILEACLAFKFFVKYLKGIMSRKPTKSDTVFDCDINRPKNCLAPDYFVLLFPINSLMALIITLLLICAVDPEEFSIFGSLRENSNAPPGQGGGGGWIASFLFAFVLFFNLVMTAQVLKLCEKHGLNSATTTKWIGQTLLSGVLSWKVLKEADDMLCKNAGDNNSGAGMANCLVGPFFLTCNKMELDKACRPNHKQSGQLPIVAQIDNMKDIKPVRQYNKKPKQMPKPMPKQMPKLMPKAQNYQSAHNVRNVPNVKSARSIPNMRNMQNVQHAQIPKMAAAKPPAARPSVHQIWKNNSNALTVDKWPKPRPKPKNSKQISWVASQIN